MGLTDLGKTRQTGSMIKEVTLFHNPRCSTSRAALVEVENSGKAFHVVHYLKERLSEQQLRELVSLFADDPTQLVRRDAAFTRLGLTDEAVQNPDQIVAVLLEHPELLQRPVLIRHDADGDRAIIGRPKQAVPEFLSSHQAE